MEKFAVLLGEFGSTLVALRVTHRLSSHLSNWASWPGHGHSKTIRDQMETSDHRRTSRARGRARCCGISEDCVVCGAVVVAGAACVSVTVGAHIVTL